MNEQFISRNQTKLAEVITVFKELTDSNNQRFCLYVDSTSWELFDQFVGRTIFRHEFKHIYTLIDNMRLLNQMIMNTAFIPWRKDGHLKHKEASAVKYLNKLYSESEVNFIIYGTFDKK